MFPQQWEWDSIWMTLVVFVPSVFALGLLFFPRGKENAMRWWSLIGTALTLGLSIGMFWNFRYDTVESHGVLDTPQARKDASLPGRVAAVESIPDSDPRRSRDWICRYEWIRDFHIDYFLGADGISMALVLLTTALCFLAMIASWKIDKFVRGYCILFLILETGMLGTFLALDFFLFYIFWEVMLLPMYFLIGVWGGPRREYAAIKFFLYTLLGSVFILVALLAFYFTNVRDFVTPQRLEALVGDKGGPDLAAARTALANAMTAGAKVAEETQADVDRWEAARKDLEEKNEALRAKPAPDAEADAQKAEIEKATKELKAAEPAHEQALAKRAAADRKVELARIKEATAAVNAKDVVVNTFDLILLQRVGKAAQEHLHGDPQTSAPIVDDARAVQARIESERKEGKGGWTEADKTTADKYVTAAEKRPERAAQQRAVLHGRRSSTPCSCSCSSASPSRCRSSRSTPGCRTPTSRRRRPSA